MEATGPNAGTTRGKLFGSALGTVINAGLAALFALLFHASWLAWIWTLVSAFVSAWTFILHLLNATHYWQGKVLHLKGIKICGSLIQVIGVCGFVMLLTLALDGNKEFAFLSGPNFWVGVAGCMNTLVTGFMLFNFSLSYIELYSGMESFESRESLLAGAENGSSVSVPT